MGPPRSVRSVAGGGGGGSIGAYGKSKQHFLRSLDLNEVITPADHAEGAFTSTKLICALGPSSHSVPVLEAMLNAGMVGARIDLTWGGLEFHRRSLAALQTAMANTRKICCVVVDTLGREVMVRRPCVIGEDGWPEHPDPLNVAAGQKVTLTTRADAEASSGDAPELLLPVTYPLLHGMCEAGDTIYIGRYLVCGSDDASLYLQVKEVNGQDIVCEAQNSAVMDGLMTVFHMERSSDSLLNLQNNLPLLSDYDRATIEALGAEFEIDFISLAYTRTREDVRECRQFLDGLGLTNCRVLAKVETRQALLNYRGILAAVDGVIISRGNIGLDVAPEKMALVQKQLISNCNLLGKPVLITRVVDSMVNNPRPTRAEATDIANAVLDGVDGIFLGAETLRGEHPVESVATIAQICRVAEGIFNYSSHYDFLMEAAQELEVVVKAAAVEAAAAAGAGAGNGAAKAVAFAAQGGSSDDTGDDGASDTASDVGSYASDLHALHATAAAMASSGSFGNLQAAHQELHAFTKYGGAGRSVAHFPHKSSSGGSLAAAYAASGIDRLPFLSKLESLASSAVRAAGKVEADLIVVYTATGRTAQLVAKYRPPMPILTLVVPRLINDGIKWRLEGRSTARACQLTRGLMPMLATPGPNGDAVLESAIVAAAAAGLVAPRRHVVVLQQIHDEFVVKIMTLDKSGRNVAGSRLRPKSRAASKGGAVSTGLLPTSPALLHRETSTGALIDSDTDGDDAWASDDDGGAPYLATTSAAESDGSFNASPSLLYSPEAAKAVSAAARVTKVPAAKPSVKTAPAASRSSSGVSPSTPGKLAAE